MSDLPDLFVVNDSIITEYLSNVLIDTFVVSLTDVHKAAHSLGLKMDSMLGIVLVDWKLFSST